MESIIKIIDYLEIGDMKQIRSIVEIPSIEEFIKLFESNNDNIQNELIKAFLLFLYYTRISVDNSLPKESAKNVIKIKRKYEKDPPNNFSSTELFILGYLNEIGIDGHYTNITKTLFFYDKIKDNLSVKYRIAKLLIGSSFPARNKEALEILSTLEDQQDKKAFYLLSEVYKTGRIVKKDDERTLNYLLKAANLNHPEACYDLYKRGYEIKYLWISSEAHYPDALNEMGLFCSRQSKFTDAMTFFEKGMYLGCPKCNYNAGKLYLGDNLNIIEKNLYKAEKCFHSSADKQYIPAMYDLAINYLEGGAFKYSNKKALYWLTKASKKDHAPSILYLGFLYYEGKVLKKDLKMACKYFEKAEALGYTNALRYLGSMYYHGNYYEKDYQKAFEYFDKALKLKDYEALTHLSEFYRYGYYVEKDEKKSFELLMEAKKKGIKSSLVLLAVNYYGNGLVVEKNLEVKRILLEEAIEKDKNNIQALLYLGYHYYNSDDDKKFELSREYFERVIDNEKSKLDSNKKHYAYALYNIGIMYSKGEGVSMDLSKALNYLRRSSKQGNSFAYFKLGEMYENGDGVAQNDDVAYKYYIESYKSDNTDAILKIYEISQYREHKSISLLEIIDKMKQYYMKSEKLSRKLAWIHYKGESVEKNLHDSLNYVESCIKLGGKNIGFLKSLITKELGLITDDDVSISTYLKKFENDMPKDLLLRKIEDDLSKDFSEGWNKISDSSKISLKTAILFFISFNNSGLDYSAVTNPLLKSLEIEVGEIFYAGYLNYLNSNLINPNEVIEKVHAASIGNSLVVSGIKRKNSQIYDLSLKTPNTISIDNFSLGKLPYIVGLDAYSASITEENKFLININSKSINKHFIDYFISIISDFSIFDNSRIVLSNYIFGLISKINEVIDNIRNPGAHNKVITYYEAESTLNLIIKVEKLLIKLVNNVDYNKLKQ
jgi:TPR repeat protein